MTGRFFDGFGKSDNVSAPAGVIPYFLNCDKRMNWGLSASAKVGSGPQVSDERLHFNQGFLPDAFLTRHPSTAVAKEIIAFRSKLAGAVYLLAALAVCASAGVMAFVYLYFYMYGIVVGLIIDNAMFTMLDWAARLGFTALL